jgi:hypothetical protein
LYAELYPDVSKAKELALCDKLTDAAGENDMVGVIEIDGVIEVLGVTDGTVEQSVTLRIFPEPSIFTANIVLPFVNFQKLLLPLN